MQEDESWDLVRKGEFAVILPYVPPVQGQIATQKQHGPCQLSGAESGKAIYIYIQNPSVTPYLLGKTGKPTKCPVEILPISHIHSGKTASGTTWVHMESSKCKSVGLISWIMWRIWSSTWTFIGSTDTRTDTRKCQTWSKTMQNMAQLWHYSLSDSHLENVDNLQKKYCTLLLHLQWKLQGTPVAPPWGLCLGSSAPMSLDRPRMGTMKSETLRLQEVRRTTFHEISSKPRGSTVRWLRRRWPCQAKSAPLRCTASGLSQMRVPCGNTSSQANLPGISRSEPTASRFSVPASKTK